MNKPLCVVSCPILTSSGYGFRSYDFVKALYELKKDEWDIKVLPQRWGSTPWNSVEDNKYEWLKPLIIQGLDRQPDCWCQITVPNEFQPVGKYNIGITAGIETNMCDASWIEGLNRMNINLVSSQHAKTVFEFSKFDKKDNNTGQIIAHIKLEKPVDVLLEGIDLSKYFYIEPKNLPKTDMVSSLDAIQESFCYLFVGHWMQGELGEDRKNVGLTIKTFLETFKDKKSKPALILKTSRGTNSIMDRDEILEKIDQVRKTVKGKDLPNIYLLHGDLDDADMNNLYNHPKVKAMLYLTKGEGFGRPLAEFFMSKKPAIVSSWSGHLDFCSPEFGVFVPGELKDIHPSAQAQNMLIEGSKWFYPNMSNAAKKMEDIFSNYQNYVDNAKRNSHFVKTNFSFENMKEKLSNYFDIIPKPLELKLPKLTKLELPNLKKL